MSCDGYFIELLVNLPKTKFFLLHHKWVGVHMEGLCLHSFIKVSNSGCTALLAWREIVFTSQSWIGPSLKLFLDLPSSFHFHDAWTWNTEFRVCVSEANTYFCSPVWTFYHTMYLIVVKNNSIHSFCSKNTNSVVTSNLLCSMSTFMRFNLLHPVLLHHTSISIYFSCEEAALEVLMYVCLSVCPRTSWNSSLYEGS